MNITILLFLICLLGPSAMRASEPYSADGALRHFQDCFNQRDTAAFGDWLLSQERYELVLAGLVERNLSCLSSFDQTYSTRKALVEIQESIRSAGAFLLDSIAPLRESRLIGCGGITYRKLDARAYFRQTGQNTALLELPLSLVLIELGAGEQKLMMPVMNLKTLSNAPQ